MADNLHVNTGGSRHVEQADRLADGTIVRITKVGFGPDDTLSVVDAANPLPVTLDGAPQEGAVYYTSTEATSSVAATNTDIDIQDASRLGRVGRSITVRNVGTVGLNFSVSDDGVDFPNFIELNTNEEIVMEDVNVHTLRIATAADGTATSALIIAL